MRKYICCIVILSFFLLQSAALAAEAVKSVVKKEALIPKTVRVAIVREARELTLSIEGAYTFRDMPSGKVLARLGRLSKSRVRLLDKGILMGLDVYAAKRILIEPSHDATIVLNNHRFRGKILIIRTEKNRLTVVNNINIEDYIKGVLYHEVSHYWPMEALKAQAVATRTYALYSMGGSGSKDYDMTNDIYSQVYGGRESERYRTGLAVDRTQGEVVAFNNKYLSTYFHATCAGMTEDAKELWNINLAPLKGVSCSFCQDSPHMRWKRNFRLKDLQDKLINRGFTIGAIKEIAVVDRNRSDRINMLKITDREGHEILINGKDFREVLGPNVLKSNNYEISMQGYYVDFIGKGWGHGVGMCQWGARGMANGQFNYKQIINYYYPHAAIVDYHDLENKPAMLKPKSKSEL